MSDSGSDPEPDYFNVFADAWYWQDPSTDLVQYPTAYVDEALAVIFEER